MKHGAAIENINYFMQVQYELSEFFLVNSKLVFLNVQLKIMFRHIFS